MNAYEKSIALGLAGNDKQIVGQLRSLTATPISITYLMELLNFRGMLRKTDGQAGTERWQGTLQTLKAALVAAGMTDYVNAYELWFSHVTNPRQTNWDTSKPAFAVAFAAMESAFADQPGMPTSEDFQAVISLGGGRPFGTLTAEQFDEQRKSDQNDSLKQNALERVVNTAAEAARTEYRKAESTPQTIIASAMAILEAG